jgi:hypothetical protein
MPTASRFADNNLNVSALSRLIVPPTTFFLALATLGRMKCFERPSRGNLVDA